MTESALVAGAGPGLGLSLARAFAAEGLRVALLARNAGRLHAMTGSDPALVPMVCDVTDPAQVTETVAQVESDLGPLAVAVFNAGAFAPGSILKTTPDEFERCWRVGAFAGFLVGQAAARSMVSRGRGTLFFTGATASLRGAARFANLASPKFALRALAQSMARELGPQGLHVAHVIIDGGIGRAGDPDTQLDPDAIAALYVALHRQPRSAWTHEADLRPWSEKF